MPNSSESFDVHPTHDIHTGIVIGQEVTEVLQFYAVVDEFFQRVILELFGNVLDESCIIDGVVVTFHHVGCGCSLKV